MRVRENRNFQYYYNYRRKQKVPTKCPLNLLAKVRYEEGKALLSDGQWVVGLKTAGEGIRRLGLSVAWAESIVTKCGNYRRVRDVDFGYRLRTCCRKEEST